MPAPRRCGVAIGIPWASALLIALPRRPPAVDGPCSKRSVEHNGAVAVEQDAVLAMPGDRPGEGEPFGVPTHRDQVLGGAAMVDAGEFLLDDRTLVEFRGDVMRGRTDVLHAPFVGLVVG